MNMASAAAISSSDYRTSGNPACGTAATVNRQSSQASSNGPGSSPNRSAHYAGYQPVSKLDDEHVGDDDDLGKRLEADDDVTDEEVMDEADCSNRLTPQRGDRLSVAVDRLQASVKGFCDSHRMATPITSNLKRRSHGGGGAISANAREKKTPTFRVPSEKRKQVYILLCFNMIYYNLLNLLYL